MQYLASGKESAAQQAVASGKRAELPASVGPPSAGRCPDQPAHLAALVQRIAHDFNNAVTIINGYAEVMLEGLDAADPMRLMAAHVTRSCRRAASLTRQLLALNRRLDAETEGVSLNELLADMQASLAEIAGPNIELQLKLNPEVGTAGADLLQLEQVVYGLVCNAVEAMPDGGSVAIETGLGARCAAAGRGCADDRWIVLKVADTGSGMDDATLERVFEPFFTTKERGQASGLVMFALDYIVRQSGGRMEVSSMPGQGTVVTVLLMPARSPRAAASSRPPARNGAARNEGPVVLLVDDEAAVRELTCRALRKAGLTVLDAGSGPEAVQVAKQHAGPIHVLISDVMMSPMSGPQLADQLLEQRPELKVVYMSGYAEHAAVDRSDHVFLEKPFSPRMLVSLIRDLVGSPAPEAACR